jgi:putative membrane protein
MTKIDRQREHQANERTFLAWLRTSIALIGFGFAIARFGLFLRELQTSVIQQNCKPSQVSNACESIKPTRVLSWLGCVPLLLSSIPAN